MPKGALAQLVVLAAIAMIVGTGLCLLDTDDAARGDLCLSLLATLIVLFPGLSLTPTGHLVPVLAHAYRRYPSDLPAPPPKA
ncbi:MAG: hypothetical protein HYY64_06005 [Candidatus Rokubacteria bacterium]|nr:hypothetical protein [Candidatus Rokubacteria bacterium]